MRPAFCILNKGGLTLAILAYPKCQNIVSSEIKPSTA